MLPFLSRNRATVALLLAVLSGSVAATSTRADTCTRAEALEIAEVFRTHRWEAKTNNVLHGPDRCRN